jgi:3-oxoacyl-[acyl-carrier protein] reductase
VDLGLAGKVAWVTGASSGLGRATAAALATEGAAVALSARRTAPLEQAASEIGGSARGRVVAVPLDVSDPAAVGDAHERVAQELGVVDVLVANAGGPPPGTFQSLGDDALQGAFALTLRSAWSLARAVVPGMRRRRAGSIVFLTSSSTKEVIEGLLLSNMMRAAVVGMAKTLSKELGPDGIRVLCVAPGRISTPRLESLDRAAAERAGTDVEDIRTANQSGIPLRRYGRPEEFGAVVAFLASERASYITGTSVVVDGGLLDSVLA